MVYQYTISLGNQKLYVKSGFHFSLKTSKDGFVLWSLHLYI